MPSERWVENEKHIREEMAANPHATFPWEWGTISATSYVGPGVLLAGELGQMKEAGVKIPDWHDLDAPNLLHQRYHLWRWERMHAGASVANMQTICEIGGGYGAMAIVCSRLGFRGRYYIEDLPVLRELQAKHLKQRGLKCNVNHGMHDKPDLLIALCSLSEMPVDERDRMLARAKPKSWLISFQPDWEGVSNEQYFAEWGQRQFAERNILRHMEVGPPMSHVNYLTSYWGVR